MSEGRKEFRLKKVEANSAGFAQFERAEPDAIDEFLEGAKEVTNYIAEQASERTVGLRDAIKAKALTVEQKKALSNAIAAALAVASPQGGENFVAAAIDTEAVTETANVFEAYVPVTDEARETQEEVSESRFMNEVEEKIRWWQTNMAEHFKGSLELAGTPTVGNENLTREQYIQTKLQFNEHNVWGNIPEATQTELRRLIPALAIQESGYHNGLVSKNGAVGILQQIPDAISHLSEYSVSEVQQSLAKQVEVAGNYFVNARYVMFDSERFGVGETAERELLRRHSQDEFEQEFLPLALLNGYNVGPAGMAREIRDYFKVPEHLDNDLTGAELFYDIIEWARETKAERGTNFGDDARNYVPKIYAAAEIMQDPLQRRALTRGVQIARNTN